MADDGDDSFGWFLGGLVCGAFVMLLIFTTIYAETPRAKDARLACQSAGFHGGTYDATRGFICFNYVSERLP